MAHDEPCEVSGFAASQYELESDITSTAAMAPDLVAFAAANLDSDQLQQTHEGVSIAELVASVQHFEGEPIDIAHNGRLYAIPLAEGSLAIGDAVTVS